MNLDRYKPYLVNQDRYAYAREKFLYHLLWNVLPVTVMLLLFGWLSLQAGSMIEASKPSGEAVAKVSE